jgi:hypothetical protein
MVSFFVSTLKRIWVMGHETGVTVMENDHFANTKKNELIKHVNRMETILVVCFSVPANNTKIDEQTHVMVDDGQNAQHLTYSSFYFKVATL